MHQLPVTSYANKLEEVDHYLSPHVSDDIQTPFDQSFDNIGQQQFQQLSPLSPRQAELMMIAIGDAPMKDLLPESCKQESLNGSGHHINSSRSSSICALSQVQQSRAVTEAKQSSIITAEQLKIAESSEQSYTSLSTRNHAPTATECNPYYYKSMPECDVTVGEAYAQNLYEQYFPHFLERDGSKREYEYDIYNNDIYSMYGCYPSAVGAVADSNIEAVVDGQCEQKPVEEQQYQKSVLPLNPMAYSFYEQPDQSSVQSVTAADGSFANKSMNRTENKDEGKCQPTFYPGYYYAAPLTQTVPPPMKRSIQNCSEIVYENCYMGEDAFIGQQIYCDPAYYAHSMPLSNGNGSKKMQERSRRAKQPLQQKSYRKCSEDENNQEDSSMINVNYQNLNLSASHEIRKRKRKNNDQLKILKIEYQKGGFWGKEKILEVSQITGLSESQVYKWCWDQKKKRLETFKKKLGGKLMSIAEGQLENIMMDMSGDAGDDDDDDDDNESYGCSPEKYMKLNEDAAVNRGAVASLKANISKLSNDFTISQLQEKVFASKSRALTNITDKVLSKHNSVLASVVAAEQSMTENKKQQLQQQQVALGKVGGHAGYSNSNQENIQPISGSGCLLSKNAPLQKRYTTPIYHPHDNQC